MNLLLGLCLLGLGLPLGQSCTLICAGKDATVDGSTLISHTDDAGGMASDVRLTHVPAMDHEKGAQRPIYAQVRGYPRVVTNHRGPYYKPVHGQEVFKPMGYIPQVQHTYGYYDHDFGLTNEVGLSIAETTVGAKTYGWPVKFPAYGYNLLDITELSEIALERCETARCAIQTMGDLAVKYGFYNNLTGEPTKPEVANTAEALGISDRTGEVWVFHIMTGDQNRSAIWAAQRVPDGHICAVPNGMVIREIDFNDQDNFMYSHNVKDLALKRGWWNPEEGPFDFTMAYSAGPPGPLMPLYVGRRIWRIYDLVAPSLKLDPYMGYVAMRGRETYPFSIRPDKKITVLKFMSLQQDYYAGTEFDLTKGKAAEPFGNPTRWRATSWNTTFAGGWERAISMFRTIYTSVIQARPGYPKAMSSILWFGYDAPHGTVWVPFVNGFTNAPPSFMKGKQSEFSLESAFWAFNFVNNWSYQMFRLIHQEMVREQRRLQQEGFDLIAEFDRSARHGVSQRLIRRLEERSTEFAEYVVSEWWKLAFRLVAKYNNGYICTGERVGQQRSWGYPISYLEEVGYTAWPGNTFYPVQSALPALPAALPAAANDTQEVARFAERAPEPELKQRQPSQAAAGLSMLRSVGLVAVGWVGMVLAIRWAGGQKEYEELP